jgi:hypothetical protein
MAVFDSPIFRNAVAAALTSVAAALLYRKSTIVDDRDDEDWSSDGGAADYDAPPPKSGTAKTIQRKAAAAAKTVSKTAKRAASKSAKSEVTQAAKAAVKTAAKAAVKKSAKAAVAKTVYAIAGNQRRSKSALDAQLIAEPSTDERRRKVRSDAGVKRTPRKTRAAVGASGAAEFASGTDAQTSPLAPSGASASVPEVMPGQTDKHIANVIQADE